MKLPVMIIMGLIVLSLASGMFFLAKDDGSGDRVVKALTFRIILSLILFAILILGAIFNVIEPNSLTPSIAGSTPTN
ncbi:MAG: twin transmembrane helix small protein [Thiotrichales bacterium]|nr:twin transmembrane helix small protein [Thiotrichales bacterium]MBT3613788.1 twin transmembrane helix small protein [Thiotrichales bacterium]MBT3753228.1 twin transmembrane helix small protein [Thiotrichales bacterium]MBT3837867.1 twin transmembrane helix small protein [Thiotrichales bacterium]MBT4152080.1 twin transmembrane helix small protein [Thiotrichales bacterium]